MAMQQVINNVVVVFFKLHMPQTFAGLTYSINTPCPHTFKVFFIFPKRWEKVEQRFLDLV